MSAPAQVTPLLDRLIRVTGTVQGVGYRPFAARLAARYGIRGWVRNDLCGVQIRAAARDADALAAFAHALRHEAPPAVRQAQTHPRSPPQRSDDDRERGEREQ